MSIYRVYMTLCMCCYILQGREIAGLECNHPVYQMNVEGVPMYLTRKWNYGSSQQKQWPNWRRQWPNSCVQHTKRQDGLHSLVQNSLTLAEEWWEVVKAHTIHSNSHSYIHCCDPFMASRPLLFFWVNVQSTLCRSLYILGVCHTELYMHSW